MKSSTNGKSEENSSSEESPPLAVLPKQRKRSLDSSEHEQIPKKIKIDRKPSQNATSVNPHATRQAYSNIGSAPQYLYHTAAPSFDQRSWQEYSESERQVNYYATDNQISSGSSYSYANHINEVQPTIAPVGLSYYPQYSNMHETYSQSSTHHPQYQYSAQVQSQPLTNVYSSLHYSPALLPINVNPLNGVSHPLTNEHVTDYATRLENFRSTNS